jgi:phosphate transport system ATP-binding protein
VPSGPASEPAEPQPSPASQSAHPVAGFARQDGRRDTIAIPASQYPDHPAQDGRYPDGNGSAGGRLPQLGPLVDMETRDIAAWFGDHKVLEGVSLKMEAGKVTALIGPSGCGKSTFLRILNRMHEMVRTAALAGEVLLGGEDIYGPRQRPADVRRRIGMVFQKPNPFPAMSIYDNVASGLRLAGIKVRNRDDVVETSLQRAGLWNEVQRRLRTPGGALSGGQQQRLCIARSLAVSPEVLLMDEPCSALDPTSTRRIEDTIRELAGQVTIVIVTHNMQQAQRVSANCAFFLATEGAPGYIVESGPTEQLFANPTDPRTAAYIHGQFG